MNFQTLPYMYVLFITTMGAVHHSIGNRIARIAKKNHDIGSMDLSGTYAIGHVELPQSEYGQAWDYMYHDWLPNSGCQPRDTVPFMDYTYFPFFDKHLRSKKLRFGVVLNHQKMQFELWLMGQNAEVQKDYWMRLKDTQWNKNQTVMQRKLHSIFNKFALLTKQSDG